MTHTAIITSETRINAIKHVMILLRASGPCSKAQMKREIVFQTPGVTAENVDEVFGYIWPMMNRSKKTAMVQVYEMFPSADGTVDEPVYEVADRMYDARGHYLGAE